MTEIKSVQNLPKIEVTVPLYKTSEPYEKTVDENGKVISGTYYAQFQYQGSEVEIGEGETRVSVGAVTCPMSGGAFVKFNTSLLGDGNESVEFFLAPDDLWYLVAKAAGIDIDALEAKASELAGVKKTKTKSAKKRVTRKKQEVQKEHEPEIVEHKISMFDPDYSLESRITGGKLSDFPEPHIWYWQSGMATRKRKVIAKIMRYFGIGEHYYMSVHEESDYLWDGTESEHWPGKPNGWIELWEEKHTQTEENFEYDDVMKLNSRPTSYILAKGILLDVIAKYFPDHEVVWDDMCEHYERDGD